MALKTRLLRVVIICFPYPRDVAKFVVENLDEIIKMYQPSGEVTRPDRIYW